MAEGTGPGRRLSPEPAWHRGIARVNYDSLVVGAQWTLQPSPASASNPDSRVYRLREEVRGPRGMSLHDAVFSRLSRDLSPCCQRTTPDRLW